MKLIIIISIFAILAFLIALCIIYFDNIKTYFKNKKKSKKVEPKPVQKQVFKAEDFKPIINQNNEMERDASLEALFANEERCEELADEEMLNADKLIQSESSLPNKSTANLPDKNFESFFNKKNKKNSNKSLSEQIKDLPPELKALLLDSTLKKRDDV